MFNNNIEISKDSNELGLGGAALSTISPGVVYWFLYSLKKDRFSM